MKKLSIADEWQFYLNKVGLTEATMHPVQLQETKRAFYAACGQTILMINDHLVGKTDDEIRLMMQGVIEEIKQYWNGETQTPSKMVEPTGNCMMKNCPNEAGYTVHFELRATKAGVSATSSPVLRVCKDHLDVKFDDLYSEKGWKQISDALASIGRMRPVKEYSGISIIPITSQPKLN